MKIFLKYLYYSLINKNSMMLIFIIAFLTFIERLPFISIISYILEKFILLNAGAVIIHILKKSHSPEDFRNKINSVNLDSFLFHFLPISIAINFTLIIITSTISLFFIYTFSINLFSLSIENILLQISTNYIITILFTIYIFIILINIFGKISISLQTKSFKAAFISMIISLIDIKYILTRKTKFYFYLIGYSIFAIFYYTLSTAILNNIYLNIQLHGIDIIDILSILIISILSVINIYLLVISSYFANHYSN